MLHGMQTTKPTVLQLLSYALHLRQCSGFLYIRRVFARRSEPAAYVWLKGLLRIEKADRAGWQRNERTAFLADQLQGLLTDVGGSGKQVDDAHVVATMLTHGVGTVVTMNLADLARFERYVSLVQL
jgi:predicted nucleic acid-binding protein